MKHNIASMVIGKPIFVLIDEKSELCSIVKSRYTVDARRTIGGITLKVLQLSNNNLHWIGPFTADDLVIAVDGAREYLTQSESRTIGGRKGRVMSKLKPCPFCGGQAERFTIESAEDYPVDFGGDVIQCKKCFASTKVFFGEKLGIVAAWNKRAAERGE